MRSSYGTSPWGQIDHMTNILPGMQSVSTPSHGGILVDRDRLAQMPAYMRSTNYSAGGAFEEDVDWAIPFCVFEAEIISAGDAHSRKLIAEGHHKNTLRNWHPAKYEKFYGVTLAPGESSRKDEDEWKKVHMHDLQVVSAFGDWQNGVPAGMVGVVACVGGRADNGRYGGPERYFLVPAEDYKKRNGTFIVDPGRDTEVADFTNLGTKQAVAR